MNDYYSDKYNLDVYSEPPREAPARKPSSRGNTQARHAAKTRSEAKRAAARYAQKSPVTEKKAERIAPKRIAKDKNAFRAKKKPLTKGKKTLVAAVVALCALGIIAAGVFFGTGLFREFKKSQPFKYSQGVYVAGIDIGGLSEDEALAKLKENSMDAVQNMKLSVNANGVKKTYKKDDFEYKFDYKTPLAAAKLYSLKEQGIYEEPTDASGNTTATEATATELPEYELRYKVKPESIERNVRKLALKVNKKSVNAKVSKFTPFSYERFTYKEGKDGYKLVRDRLEKQIAKFIKSGKASGKINAEVKTLTPDITVEDLQNNIVGLSTATSYSYNTENGNNNMRLALEACNGSVIEPGDTWSFNDCTGDSNLEKNGYKKATVISNQKLEQGVGGGICQASTTIFQAALFANMAIVERHNHFWASSYAAPGEDATIDYPNLDLKLRNITSYQMFMECAMEGQTLTVNIYGYQDPSYDNIKVYTENYDVVKGENYKTNTYRVLYLNHEIVSEETICHSVYSLTDGYSVKDPDTGSYRVTVYGETFAEAEPETEPETSSGEEETTSEEETSVEENAEDYGDDSAEYSDEGYESSDDSEYYDYSDDSVDYGYDDSQGDGIDLPEEYIE